MLLFLPESNHTIEPGGSWTVWDGGTLLVDSRQVTERIVTLYNSQIIFFFHKVDHVATKPIYLSVPFQSCSPFWVSSHVRLSSPAIPVWISDLLQAFIL